MSYSCCNATASDRESAKLIPGCVKGKHRSKHHTDYVYANYFFYMSDLVRELIKYIHQTWMCYIGFEKRDIFNQELNC